MRWTCLTSVSDAEATYEMVSHRSVNLERVDESDSPSLDSVDLARRSVHRSMKYRTVDSIVHRSGQRESSDNTKIRAGDQR